MDNSCLRSMKLKLKAQLFEKDIKQKIKYIYLYVGSCGISVTQSISCLGVYVDQILPHGDETKNF